MKVCNDFLAKLDQILTKDLEYLENYCLYCLYLDLEYLEYILLIIYLEYIMSNTTG